MKIQGLYLITDDDHDGRLLERVEDALRGGVRIVQYRDKKRPGAEQIEAARKLRTLCHRYGALFIVNDSPEIAHQSGADGVHIGQQDGEFCKAREILGPDRIIGVSTGNAELALKAQNQGADYVGVGAVFTTGTKEDAVHIGLDGLRKVREAVSLPVVAIGGINITNAADVVDAGADSIAVVSAVMGDPSPAMAARELALSFNRNTSYPRGRVLTVAGSDSGGGAGIQADLKTITLLGSYGASALTALTAQNTQGVHDIFPVEPQFVSRQIDCVLSDIGTDTVKTGMLFSADIIRAVADSLRRNRALCVVDPVMIAKGGAPLLRQEAIGALKAELLPHTYLATPNVPEAEALTGMRVATEDDMRQAALCIQKNGARHVLVKGGHLQGEAVDILLWGSTFFRFPAQRVQTAHTHGTGCTFSAAIASFLAQGEPLPLAAQKAKDFISEAIATAPGIGSGHGPVNHLQASRLFVS